MIMNRTKHFIALAILFGGTCFAEAPVPKDGYVPDEKTAVRVAEAVLSPIYGEKNIHEGLFRAALKDGVWIVFGSTLGRADGSSVQVRIDKETGKILGRTQFYK
jgi:hypothetical protein